jgi:RNA polymerase sigma-70 factor (ECF subfamily)
MSGSVYDCPESSLFTQKGNEQVITAMSQLPWEQRNVVELKFFQHYTFEEIAKQLDVSTNTVKSRLYSALNKLKIQLEVS